MPKANTIKAVSKKEPARADLNLADVLGALNDDVRVDIVRQLALTGEKACGTFGIKISKSKLSHHFRVLQLSGVLSVRRDGKELINAIRQEDLEARFPGLLDAVLNPKTRTAAKKEEYLFDPKDQRLADELWAIEKLFEGLKQNTTLPHVRDFDLALRLTIAGNYKYYPPPALPPFAQQLADALITGGLEGCRALAPELVMAIQLQEFA